MSARIEDLKRRVQQDPTSIAFAALAEEYRRAGQCWEAVEVCRAGLQRHPAYLSARVTLGRALLEVGELDESREHLEQVVRVAPENLAAIRALAEIHRRRGELGLDAPADLPLSPAAPAADTPPAAAAPERPAARIPVRTLAPVPVEAAGEPPKHDETLARLDAFLGAIARAREALPRTGTSLSR
ncbi:MAG TPA: tetratricopeptide repeat protein [Vicinamibacterales bacterium]|nr:tetratricopeptide repeat protein [Vicinamibacterales bacterium]